MHYVIIVAPNYPLCFSFRDFWNVKWIYDHLVTSKKSKQRFSESEQCQYRLFFLLEGIDLVFIFKFTMIG